MSFIIQRRRGEAKRSANCFHKTPLFAKIIRVETVVMLRRWFAYACLDWSERRPDMDGALAAALLNVTLKKKWLIRDLDSRALGVTKTGRHELLTRFGVSV